jgi:hypothetical protein
VQDGGTPGRGADHLELRVTSPLGLVVRYEVAGSLGGGNVQVRAG